MRQRAIGRCIVTFAVTMVWNVGLVPARAADLTDTTVSPPSSSQTQPSRPTPQEKATDRRKAMHRLNEACGQDMKKLCRHVQPGGGRIVQCLEESQSELSPTCSQWLNKQETQ